MMKILFYLLKLFSYLPLFFWYLVSDILFVLQQYFIKYRFSIITENLEKSFPNLSESEIKKIRKKFNKNFCDYVVETLKTITISEKELEKRHTYSDLYLFDEFQDQGKNVIVLAGHVFNWEWLLGVIPLIGTKTYAVYHNQSNKELENLINDSRSRFGTITLSMKSTSRTLIKTPNDGNSAFLFIADQSPHRSKIYHHVKFLNQDTPVFNGFDKLARKLDYKVIYCDTVKMKRGHYHTTFKEIKPKEEKFKENEIVDSFFNELESTIKKDPSNWLWSHKRWKHSRNSVN